MRASRTHSILRRLLVVAVAFVALAVGAQKDSPAVFAIGTFAPASSVALCDQFTGPVVPSDPLCTDAPGSLATNNPSHVTHRLALGAADYNYSLLAMASPGSGFMAAGPGNPAHGSGTDPGIGDLMGRLVTDVGVGAGNAACSANMVLGMKLINATVDNSAGNSLNPILIAQTGAFIGGALENMQSDTGTAANAPSYTPPAGIPANGLPASVDRYPSFLNAMFDPDFTNYGPNGVPFDGDDVNGATPPLQPRARYVGNAIYSGVAVHMNFVVFSAGALAAAFPAPHPFADLTSDMGYTTLVVWQDPTQTAPPTVLDNICTDVTTLMTLWGEARSNHCNGSLNPPCDTPAGIIDPAVPLQSNLLDRARTPLSAGTYLYVTYMTSQRDADGDGFENELDSCANTANAENPKTTAGADGDKIDPACDPTPVADTNSGNHDSDVAANGAALINVADNCPTVSNGSQADAELTHSYYEDYTTNPAPQGGPKSDEIGDACDPDDVRANGVYLADLDLAAKCIGGTDADGDGYCAIGGPGVGVKEADDGFAARTPEAFALMFTVPTAMPSAGINPLVAVAESASQCTNSDDDDGDRYVNDGCPTAGATAEPAFDCLDLTNDDPADDSEVNDGCTAIMERHPVQVCNDGMDNDGDTLVDNLDHGNGTFAQNRTHCRPQSLTQHPTFPACPVLGCAPDQDGDGFTDEAERHVGTNPLGRCGVGGVQGDPPSAAWPSDFIHGGVPDSTDLINIVDLTSFIAPIRRFDTEPSDQGFASRWDLVPGASTGNNWIDIIDLVSPFAGSSGYPPMTSGTPVFNTSTLCTNHPVFGE
jgi:hypothetical protein